MLRLCRDDSGNVQNVQTFQTMFKQCWDSVQTMFRLSDSVQTFQTMFRVCSDNVQSMFRQCEESSDFSDNVQNLQTFQTMFRMLRICSDFSDNVQNVQTFQTMFRLCSEFVQNVQTMFRICSDFSEFRAQKLVYWEFLDCVVYAISAYQHASTTHMSQIILNISDPWILVQMIRHIVYDLIWFLMFNATSAIFQLYHGVYIVELCWHLWIFLYKQLHNVIFLWGNNIHC